MSDEPRDGTVEGADLGRNEGAGNEPEGSDPSRDPAHGPSSNADAGNDESAPWERPRRWNQDPLDATRVDDLLARLSPADAPPSEGRRRRRAADDAVPASELIAALSADAPTVTSKTKRPVGPPDGAPPAPPARPAATDAQVGSGGEAPEDATVFLGAGWAADEPATPAQDDRGVTAAQDDRTVLLPPRIGPGAVGSLGLVLSRQPRMG